MENSENEIHYKPVPRTRVKFVKNNNNSYLNRKTVKKEGYNQEKNFRHAQLADKYGWLYGLRNNSDVNAISNYTNESNSDYNNGENFGQIQHVRRTKRKTVRVPTEHTTTLNKNNKLNKNPEIPKQITGYSRYSRSRKVSPVPQIPKPNTKKQNWVDERSKKLISARADLLSAFSTLENLVRYEGKKLRGSIRKTKKNMSLPEITISENMDSLTTIIANLEDIIPPAPEETPPPRPPQENNNSLNSNSSNA